MGTEKTPKRSKTEKVAVGTKSSSTSAKEGGAGDGRRRGGGGRAGGRCRHRRHATQEGQEGVQAARQVGQVDARPRKMHRSSDWRAAGMAGRMVAGGLVWSYRVHCE